MEEQGTLLRIYVNENAHHGRRLLYKALIDAAHGQGLAGATVFRGLCGYQAGHGYHDSSLLRLSDDMPVLVEIVDTEDKIRSFLPVADEMVDDGLITLEKVTIVKNIRKSR